MSVFTDAIRVLEERGWHQGGYEGNDGSVCLLGALNLARGRTVDSNARAATDLYRALVQAVPSDRPPHEFNDDPHTTYEDVVLALKRAHELAEAE